MRFNISEYFGAKPVTRIPRFEMPASMPKVKPAKKETQKTEVKMEPRKFVVYLAGKITGDDEYREKFARYEAMLQRFSGIAVLNPAHAPLGLRPADYMRLAFAQIETADVVCFLPDWGHSAGASLEMQYCRYIGKRWLQLPADGRGFDFWTALARADAERDGVRIDSESPWRQKHLEGGA